MMEQEKQKRTLIMIAYYGVILLGVYLGFRFLVPPLLPFLIGFLVAWMLHRPAVVLGKKLHLSQKLLAVLLATLFYILLTVIVIFAGAQLISLLKEFLPKLPDMYTNQLLPFLDGCVERVKDFVYQIEPAVAEEIDAWADTAAVSIGQTIASFSGTAVKSASSAAAAMPMMILRVVLTIISTFFVSVDFKRIVHFLKRLLPEKAEKMLHPIKEKTIHSLKVFLRSYCLLFLVTFAELSIGFFLMRIPYAGWIGLLVAVVDIMPVLGTGTVLLPWAVIAVFMKNFPLAIGMALLYVIITVIRNIVEPKLVGQQIGLHPLATLISMFLGLQLLGIIGLFAFPVILSLLIQFRKDGVLPLPSWMKEQKK